ncbi:MAG: fibro-slime domain-containing protein [Fibromonadaceae bacterium]|jgi:fibro-slime domain-containing protein|nr:fibro-slime domain-containing protein [Fibromonadaceae bacterium]
MNPVKTLCFTLSLVALLATSAAAQTLYFYPPDDAKWIAGRSYISQGSAATAVALDLVSTGNKCGWYSASIPSSSPLRNFAQFWLGKPGIDRIGPNGIWSKDFEPSDDFSAVGGVFRLGEIFEHFGVSGTGSLYVVADELDPNDEWAGWYTTDPTIANPEYNTQTRCEWKLAAFIYDTDPSVHPDFSCGSWVKGLDEGNGPSTKGTCEEGPQAYDGAKGNLKPLCTGVVFGLAAPTLGDDRKIKCGNCTKNGCWKDASWFEKAFTPTEGVNVRRCYDMPFTQVKTGKAQGSFEFDSDKMAQTGNNNRLIGGFFPELLNSRGSDDYSKCSSCDTKRSADRFPPKVKALTKEIFDDYNSREGDFKDGDTPKLGAFGLTPAGDVIYDWNARNDANTTNPNWGPWYLHGDKALKNTYGDSKTEYDAGAKANQHFCFESHADFYYDPSQEFYFSGDDPIWVYIDKKLVIDLGGSHMAAPGHVKLSDITPKLEEGKLYPIDIFFCDQRTVNSNVRITTNMYVVQKSAFSQEPDNAQNVMCAAITGGSECESKMSGGGTEGRMCGKQLIDGGYTVDFYMVNRVTKEVVYLSGPARSDGTRYPTCIDNGTTGFQCNGANGIVVNNAVYKCGGRFACRGSAEATANVGIQGSFNVYARLMNANGTPVTGAKVLLIDSFKGESNDRIVWGQMVGDNGTNFGTLKNAYGGNAVQSQDVVAGKWIPVYISTGRWGGENAFEYDDDPEVAGHGYKLTVLSGGAGLTIYKEKGGSPIGTTSATGTLPASGVDTLWVKADYDIGEKSFSLNVTGEGSASPSMIINVKQPRLEFRADATGGAVNPSGWAKWGAGSPPKPPVVGNPLDVYIVAVDPVTGDVCEHCDFSITQKSEAVGTCKSPIANPLVRGDKLKLESGRLNTYMRGQDDTGADGCTATWKIYGESDETNAQWTLLRFRESPVPVPMDNYIYDRNGDGIGDKVEIKFNKSLISKGDSLYPILLEVNWDGTPHYFYYKDRGYTVEQLKDGDFVKGLYKDAGFLSANAAYWKNSGFLKDSVTLVIETDEKFSKDVLTTGTGKVSAYIPYIDTECSAVNCNVDNAFSYSTSAYDLRDRIAPIVVKAEYVYASNNKGDCEGSSTCKETFTIWLSEAVFAGPDASGDLVKNPFGYCLGHSQGKACPTTKISLEQRQSQNDNSIPDWPWAWEVPGAESYSYSASYKQSKKGLNTMAQPGEAKGDSVIELIYYANGTNGSVHSPKADDWVKLRGDFKVFQDAQGNTFNPRERGVLVTGSNPSKKKPIHISQIKPGSPSLNGTFDGDRNGDPWFPNWIGGEAKEYGKNNLFKPGNITEFLPVPKHINNTKDVMQYYPSSVGTLFDIADNFRNEVGKLMDVCDTCSARYFVPRDGNMNNSSEANMEQLSDANVANFVTVKASAYYHTNLGNYTAHRDPVTAKCTDPIFKNAEDAGNCYTNEYNYYLAWDLKDNKGRAVGAGAYVGISKFWMELAYFEKTKDGSFKKKTKKLSEQEFIEMFGVKRTR